MKDKSFRKNWLITFESLKKEIAFRFGEGFFRNFNKIIPKLAQYHYNKKEFIVIGKERELYNFLVENGHNPYTVYRWHLLDRIPETLKFQLKNGMLNQKTAFNLHFKNKHESNSQTCVDIRVQGLNLVRSM